MTIKGQVGSTMGLRLFDGPLYIWDSNGTSQPLAYQYTGTFQVKIISTKMMISKMLLTKQEMFFIMYYQSPLKQESMKMVELLERDTKSGEISIDTTKDHIYYKQWQFNTSEYLNISLVQNNTKTILRSEYPDHCCVGGFIIKENATYRMHHGQEQHVSSTYGPYCRRTQGEPLINAINSWIFPRGVHHIVVYSYGRMFEMKMTLLITRTPCEPATDVCVR